MSTANLEESSNEVKSIISNYEVGRIASQRLESLVTTEYGRLYSLAQKLLTDPKAYGLATEGDAYRMFMQITLVGETAWMEENFGSDPKAKTKVGRFKYRSYLPKAYGSAKSVIANALKVGVVDPFEHIGKTALEGRIKGAKVKQTEDTDPIQVCWRKIARQGDELLAAHRAWRSLRDSGVEIDASRLATFDAIMSGLRAELSKEFDS